MTSTLSPAGVAADVFRYVMGTFAAGVAVVTTVDESGEPRGLTTTAITSVSLDPPLLLVCVGRQSRTLPALRCAGRFTVNLLDAEFSAIALRFASTLDDKFGELAWRAGSNGCPILHEHALAWAECRTENEVEAGDHIVFVGHVVEAEASADALPLTYFRGRYGSWLSAELPDPSPLHAGRSS